MNYDLQYDPMGGLVPPGKFYKELDWQVFNDVTLPSWLTSTVTPTLNSVASGPGTATFTTGAVSGNSAVLQLAFDIRCERFAAIDLIVDGWSFDSDNAALFDVSLNLDTWSSNHGMRFWQTTTQPTVQSKIQNVTGDADVVHPYQLIGVSNGTRMKSLMFRVVPSARGGYLFENEGLVASHLDPSKWVVASVIRPAVEIVTRSAATRAMSLSRFKLRLWQ